MAAARADIGRYPYTWGAKSCYTRYSDGLDCSGAVRCWILAALSSLDIGFGTWAQLDYCRQHGREVERPWPTGAIVFLDPDGQDGSPSHVGIVAGEGTVIECSSRFNGVRETPIAGSIWEGTKVNAWAVL